MFVVNDTFAPGTQRCVV